MHKNNNSSKKGISNVSGQNVEQYRSEGRSVQSGKPREGFAFQNMKEFKCEIDHQIAKCLDTLDRQGLKFLKETLRASKIFGLTTQQMANTQPIEENIDYEQSPQIKQKSKEIGKKIEPTKQNIQIKKVVKPEIYKKPQTSSKGVRQMQNKSELNDKINKKLQCLNIKTGKKQNKTNQPLQIEKNKKIEVKSTHQIAEQIEQQVQDEVQKVEQVQQSIKEIKQNLSKVSIKKDYQNYIDAGQDIPTQPTSKNCPQNLIETSKQQSKKSLSSSCIVIKSNEEDLHLKPFYKKPFKKNNDLADLGDNRDIGIQISKQQQIQQIVEISQHQKDRKSQFQPEINDLKEQDDPYMANLINKINKLTPSKRTKLERILQKLQQSNRSQISPSDIISNISSKKQQASYFKPSIAYVQSIKNSQGKERSNSKSKFDKHQKATSLKNSILKNNHINNITPKHAVKQQSERQSPSTSSIKIEKPKNILQLYDNAKSQIISEQKRQRYIQSNMHQSQQKEKIQVKPANYLKEDDFSKNLSQSLALSEHGQKLIKVGRKKNQPISISLKIISNNGHKSLVGLTAIQIFNLSGESIVIDENNLKQSNPKLLKLFLENSSGDGWLTTLSAAIINIQNINQAVGGIRIINWNKSELQVDRQADLMEILINEQLYWRGQLKKGSFKENEVYSTDIKISQKYFEFPPIKHIQSDSNNTLLRNQSGNKNIKLPELTVQRKKNGSVCWLEQETVQKKMKQLEYQQKQEQKIKKITSNRNTIASLNKDNDKISPQPVLGLKVQQGRSYNFAINLKKQQIPLNLESHRYPEMSSKKKPQSFKNSNDILGDFSKERSIKKKQQLISQSKRKENYLLLKQRQQDQQFEKILLSMEQRSKDKESYQPKTPKQIEIQPKMPQNKDKVIAQKNFEDFMKDSLFDEKPKPKKIEASSYRSKNIERAEEKESFPEINKKNTNKKIDLDNLIDQLNDVVGGESPEETGMQFCIPELPRGSEFTFILLSNWGNQGYIGLNGIQIFDSNGNNIRPSNISSSSLNSKQLFQKLFKNQLLTSDEKSQIKLQKTKKIVITINLKQKQEVAAIRIWNYNGHRVHNNIGVKKCQIKLDGNFIFSGEIQQSCGSSEDAYKYCEYILFTENNNILKKINQKDWLSKITKNDEEQRLLFKTTLQNFHRPSTRNDEESVKKQEIEVYKQPIKLPKRLCFEYDPPQLPEGFVLTFILHNSWGDKFFIGLNGIEIFNEKAENITNKNLNQIRADPSSISKLSGYENDKRIISNVINGKNNSTADNSIWLTPLLSDVQKVERGRPNIIMMEYKQPSKISGINFYNYIKTPERGVRQIEVFLDNFLLYRGYLKKYNPEEGVLHTTINFTKQQGILEMINYVGYNQDNLEQQVGLINEQKVIKTASIANVPSNQLTRPMTGRLN